MSFEISKEATMLADQMIGTLMGEASGVCQQQAIEILMVYHASRMKGPRESTIVIDGMAKHAKQLMAVIKP